MRNLQASLEAYHRQTYNGMLKTPEDMDRYARVIHEYSPDAIVEIGTYTGGSAAWFAKYAPVLTIDIHDQWQENNDTTNVTRYIGRSIAPTTLSRVRSFLAEHRSRRPMFSLDGDHSSLTVLRELYMYTPLVPNGGWCVVEDGLVRWMDGTNSLPDLRGVYGDGPLSAIELFRAQHPEWINRIDIEDLSETTQFPDGWLQKFNGYVPS